MNYCIKNITFICLFFTGMLFVKANEITLSIKFDDYANETSWNIKDSQNNIIASGGGYSLSLNGQVHAEIINLVAGSYTFTILDSASDGICCGQYGDGHYYLIDENGHSLAAGGPFGSSESVNFTIGNSTPQTIFVPNPDIPWYFNPSDFITTSEGDLLLKPSNGENYSANVEADGYTSCNTVDRLGQNAALSNFCGVKAPAPYAEDRSFYGTHVPKSGATITFWIKLTGHKDNNGLLGANFNGASNNRIFEFGADQNKLTYFKQKYKSPTASQNNYKYTLAEPFVISDINKWYFVSMTFDGFYTRVYIAEKSTGSFKCHYWWDGFYNHPDWNTSSKWEWFMSTYGLNISILDDVMIWYGNKLSKTQIDALFNCQKNGVSANCLGDIPMPPGTTVTTNLVTGIKNDAISKSIADNMEENTNTGVVVFPNPTDSDFTAQFYLPHTGDVELELIDLSGQVIFKDTKHMSEGTNQVQMNNVSSSCGCLRGNRMIIFRASGKDFVVSKKIIIK